MELKLESILYFCAVFFITGTVLGFFLNADSARENRVLNIDLIYENAELRAIIRKMADAVPHT